MNARCARGELERILAEDSEMASRMRGLDWSKTDQGRPGPMALYRDYEP